MKILSIRRGFQSDHSSTSYEFFAVDKPLSKAAQRKIGGLSSRAMPTSQRVSFQYNGEWSDLPGGWTPLMEKYYDVMYTESYDWWTLAVAFNADKKVIEKLEEYECDAADDLGLSISSKKSRVIIEISCVMNEVPHFGDQYRHADYYDEEDEEEFISESEDALLNILVENRKLIMKENYSLLYGIWSQVVEENEENDEDHAAPQSYNMKKAPAPVKELLSLISFRK